MGAFSLSKSDGARRDELIRALNEKRLKLATAIERYNERVAALREPVEEALADYNAELKEARGFVADIANEAEDTWDSEKGQGAREFVEAWQSWLCARTPHFRGK